MRRDALPGPRATRPANDGPGAIPVGGPWAGRWVPEQTRKLRVINRTGHTSDGLPGLSPILSIPAGKGPRDDGAPSPDRDAVGAVHGSRWIDRATGPGR